MIDAIVAEATTRINAAVTDGKLTQERADELIANLTTGITELVNDTPPLGFPGFGLPGFPVGGPGTTVTATMTTTLRPPRPTTPPSQPTPSAG